MNREEYLQRLLQASPDVVLRGVVSELHKELNPVEVLLEGIIDEAEGEVQQDARLALGSIHRVMALLEAAAEYDRRQQSGDESAE